MVKKTNQVDIDDIKKLPDEKIVEAFRKTLGYVGECHKCGEYTAFLAKTGINDTSKCHNCGVEKRP